MTSDIKLTHFQSDISPLISIAALFSKDFSIDWLQELTGLRPSEILSILEQACEQGLVRKVAPGLFCFVDSQMRIGLLNHLADQELLHEKIARIIMRELPDGDEKFEKIREHLLHTQNNEESIRYLLLVGDANRRDFHWVKALECYAKAIEDLRNLKGENGDSLFIEASLKYSKISMARQQTTKVLSILQEAIKRAKKVGNESYLAQLTMQLAKNKWLSSQYQSALKEFKKGCLIAEKLSDPKLLRSTNIFKVFFLIWQGLFKDAIDIYEKEIPEVWQYPEGTFPLYAAQTMGYCYTQVGHVTQGIGMLDAIRTHCLTKGDKEVAAHASLTIGNALLEVNLIEDAIKYLRWSLEEAVPENSYWTLIWGKLMLAYAHYLKSETKKSLKYLQAFFSQCSHAQISVYPYPHLLELSWAAEEGKFPTIPGHSIENEIHRIMEGKNVFLKGTAFRYLALLQRREHQQPEKIIGSLRRSLRLLNRSGHRVGLAKTYIELSRQYLSLSQQEKAKESILSASDILSPINEALIPDELRSLVKGPATNEKLMNEIFSLARRIVDIRDDKDLIQQIISNLNRIVGAERSGIFLFDNHAQKYQATLKASRNLTSEDIHHSDFQMSMKVIQDVARSRTSCIKKFDKTSDPSSLYFRKVSSCICVPLIICGKSLGVLYCDNRLLSTAFNDKDIEVLEYFASQAALALDNAIARDELATLTRQPQHKIQESEEVSSRNIFFKDIIGESAALKRVFVQVDRVANNQTPVLIYGETGVGKELVAKAIHARSNRCNNPIIAVNCSSLPDTLIFSELFGHEKGAYTGAMGQRIGRLELANGGTLFLDEIADISIDAQVRLLRVLETKEFERVGGSKTIKSDFRLIAASNRNLEEAVKNGKFRDDLFYRINVFPVYIPPLRDRKDDIPLLADYFLRFYAAKTGKSFSKISETDIEVLTAYQWPGNVRELKNVIERSVILSTTSRFQLVEMFSAKPMSEDILTLKGNERSHIVGILQKTNWKVRGRGGAAEILKVPPSTLESKMKKLGIKRPRNI
jgi:formate hydrogenlyase transcriptional activator